MMDPWIHFVNFCEWPVIPALSLGRVIRYTDPLAHCWTVQGRMATMAGMCRPRQRAG